MKAPKPTSLHVLPLPHPFILLPGNTLTLSVSRETGDELLAMIEEHVETGEEEGYISPQTRRRVVGKDRKSFLIAAVPVVSSPGTSSATSTKMETPSPGIQREDTLPPIQPQPRSKPASDSHFSDWGTAARILRLVKPPSSAQTEAIGDSPLTVRGAPTTNTLVSLQGISRVKLLGPSDITQSRHSLPSTALFLYSVSHASSSAPDTEQFEPETLIKFKQSALNLLDKLTRHSVQKGRREAYVRIAEMLGDLDLHESSSESLSRAAWMVDVLVGSVINDYNDKLAILCTPSPSSAIFTLASQIFTKHAAIIDVSQKIASAVDESLTRAQKQFFLTQQLEAIQRELYNLQRQNSSSNPASNGVHEGFSPSANPSQSSDLDAEDDDLNADPSEDASLLALKRKIEVLSPGSEERKMGSREWRRLKRIPPGSVENGVIRSYLEWLTSIPWPSSTLPVETTSPIPSFTLADARVQLDADHFGLDKVKKRLVEYLAVVRLKEGTMSSVTENEASNVKGEEKGGKELIVYDKKRQQGAQKIYPPPQVRRKPIKGPILLFVGPPGTGKTSLGQSIARALGRPFQRIALGGVRDEAEIRGHRRTYVASGPGLIVQTLRKMGRGDGVLLLDEVDKIGHSNFHGDPAAALLEALDPEQNHAFNDHYINVPIDLSQILFICTANTLETISLPFLDRCEVIRLSGYTPNEKLSIANRFLLPKQLEVNGLDSLQIQITDAAMQEIVNRYTRGEAGVRGLERKIGSVVRAKVVEWSDWTEGQKEGRDNTSSISYNPVVEQADIEKILGIAPWDANIDLASEDGLGGRAGVVYGLVVMGRGEGGILPVETVMVPGKGKLRLTGMLGDVIKESAELALSWVKTNSYDLGITNSRSDDPLKATRSVDIHLHLPAGAQKKDGPSAGITMVCAIISLLTSLFVPSTTALTGEITLRGTVSPVGGIKEKVLGAHRAGVKKVILPWANRREAEMDVPREVRREVKCVFVRSVREAVEEAFGRGVVWRRKEDGGGGRGVLEGRREFGMLVESRL